MLRLSERGTMDYAAMAWLTELSQVPLTASGVTIASVSSRYVTLRVPLSTPPVIQQAYAMFVLALG